ncbi:MAG: hypothetical protein RJA76_1231 [Bacteroidota bacterium]
MRYAIQHFWQQLKSIFTFEWENPLFLYLLVLPILLFVFKFWIQKNKRARIELTIPNDFPENKITTLLSYVPEIIQSLFIVSIVIALAGPYKKVQYTENKAEGIDIAIGLDISSSMTNKDVSPSRLEVAKKVALDFIQKRIKYDAFTIVAFAGEPNLVSPMTQDSAYLTTSIRLLQSGIISEKGTALGDAMGTCINQLRDSENPKKIGIIISDGNNTAGNLDPEISSNLAQQFKTKFYTIAVGKNGNLIDPVDEKTLRSIAFQTQGKFFRASDAKGLNSVFQEIDNLEKTKIRIYKWEEHLDQSQTFISIAIFLFLFNLALKLTWIGNIFED